VAKSKLSKSNPTLAPDEVVIQYEFVQMFTEHLTDCWQVFDGDLAEMIVLAILGQAQLGALRRDKEPFDLDANFRAQGMTASRLSDVSKIPRQTVRRKLLRMEEKGWIVQTLEGSWVLAVKDGRAPVRDELDGLHTRGVARAKKLVANLKPHV
jgi:hypothetical protein